MNTKKTLSLIGFFTSIIIFIFGALFCCVGGVIQIIEGFKASPISSLDVAFGVLRVIFTPFAFWSSVVIFMVSIFKYNE